MSASTQLNPIVGQRFQPPSSAKSSRFALNFRSLSIPASSSYPRFSYDSNFLPRKTFRATFASNSGPLPGEKSIQGKATDSRNSNETETAPQGPPFLTIVAGVLVFFLVCWVVGSLVIWAVNPIVNRIISK